MSLRDKYREDEQHQPPPPRATPLAEKSESRKSAPGALMENVLGRQADQRRIDELEAEIRALHDASPVRQVALSQIDPNPYQPRLLFDPARIEELAASINERGLIHDITLRPGREGRFILVAGERRMRAFQLLARTHIAARVVEIDDRTAALISLDENDGNEGLLDFERYHHYSRMIAQGLVSSHQEIASAKGFSRTQVVGIFAFGRLPKEVIPLLEAQPALLGYRTAQALAARVGEGHGALVIEAVKMLAKGEVGSEVAAVDWVARRLRPEASRAVTTIDNQTGAPVFRVTREERKVTVTLPRNIPPQALATAIEGLEAALRKAAKGVVPE
jgi:ParB/RepB/Spo0J family partition protein